ncbi:MAG TPA: SLC13 family permease [Candidatus Paceibacterota bacterium]
MLEQALISIIIIATLVLIVWGKWRYDIVALVALFATLLFGLIPIENIFNGFIHPVVILMVVMVILSKGLIRAGVVDVIARYLKIRGKHPAVQLGVLIVFTAFLSSFINSMGALAFVIPIAIRMAKQSGSAISMFLMPVAFASHLGGGVTLISSISNIVVSGFRAEQASPFGFFDFATISLPIVAVAIIFIVVGGWRLIPKREDVFARDAALERYVTEVKISKGSPAIEKTLADFQKFLKEHITILSLVRFEHKFPDPSPDTVLREGDILIIETDPETLEAIIATAKLELIGKEPLSGEGGSKEVEGLSLMEAVVADESSLIGESAASIKLRTYYNVNMLALHHGRGDIGLRMSDITLRGGDVLILQGYEDDLARFIKAFSLLPLKEREFQLEGSKELALALGIFVSAIAVSITGLFPAYIIFVFAGLLMLLFGLIPVKEMYQSVDVSVVVLLGVMLQLGLVFQETGAAKTFADLLLIFSDQITPTIALGIIFAISILLADILSNATVAVLLSPVALAVAIELGVSIDPFLMAVAIGSASSFLTPFGHQSNVFVMGIGGYKFKDYWRLGLPLEIITFGVGMWAILTFWPF